MSSPGSPSKHHRRACFAAAAGVLALFVVAWGLGQWTIVAAYRKSWETVLQLVIPDRVERPVGDYVGTFAHLMTQAGWWLILPLLIGLSVFGNLSVERAFALRSILRRRWMEIYFAVGLSLIFFGYGVAVGMFKLFPYELLNGARTAWHELSSTERLIASYLHVIRSDRVGSGVTVHDSTRAYDGLTLITRYRDESFELVLVDMQGQPFHRWRIPASRYLSMRHPDTLWELPDRLQMLNGAHLYENGDLLFLFDYAGLIKVDRCSNPIWTLDEPVHHVVTVEPDGTIWVPTHELVRAPTAAHPRMSVPYWDDQVLELSPAGKILRRISVLDAIFKSRYEGLFMGGSPDRPASPFEDPLHLNDVDIVDSRLAAHLPGLAPGDLMLSLRNPNAIVFVDRERAWLKRGIVGPFLRQHDPDVLPDGTLLVFDNRMDTGRIDHPAHLSEPQVFGYSRVIRIDPRTMQVIWSYEGSRASPFYTSIQGKVQPLPNGNVLVVEPEAGRVFEVEPATRTIVWEFLNSVDSTRGKIGRVTGAERIDRSRLHFLNEVCD